MHKSILLQYSHIQNCIKIIGGYKMLHRQSVLYSAVGIFYFPLCMSVCQLRHMHRTFSLDMVNKGRNYTPTTTPYNILKWRNKKINCYVLLMAISRQAMEDLSLGGITLRCIISWQCGQRKK